MTDDLTRTAVSPWLRFILDHGKAIGPIVNLPDKFYFVCYHVTKRTASAEPKVGGI